MYLTNLQALTTLPLEPHRNALSHHDLRALIPATSGRAPREHLLAATPEGLSILRPRRDRRGSVTEYGESLVPWDRVSLATVGHPETDDRDDHYDLLIRDGRRTFLVRLTGPAGKRALRDFVVTAQRGIRGEFRYLDYDAASSLTY